MRSGRVFGSWLFGTALTVCVLVVVLILLAKTLSNVERMFRELSNAHAVLEVDHVSIEGIKLTCRGRLEVTSNVPYQVEFVQFYITDVDGNYLASWNAASLNGESFEISIENPKFFGTVVSKVKVHGFVKVNFLVGRYGLKLNLPVFSEASVFRGRG